MANYFIVGGGVIGLCSAVALASEGHRVTVWDQTASDDSALGHRSGPASWGNAGHIATEQVTPLASPESLRSFAMRLFLFGGPLGMPPSQIAYWAPFALRFTLAARPTCFKAGSVALKSFMAEALPAWRRMVADLGAPDLLREDGHYVAWENAASAKDGLADWSKADTGSCTIQAASAAELAQLQGLATKSIAGAGHFHGTAQIADLDLLKDALEQRLVALGGNIRREAVTLTQAHGNVLVNGEAADEVVITSGLGSKALLEPLGHCVPIIAERGYHIRGAADNWPDDMPPVVFEDRNMIVTRYKDSVQAASFVEFAPPDSPADPRKWERLEAHVAELGLAMKPPYRRWIGCRPTLPDYLPAIGRSTKAHNLLYAFGHQHLGLTLAAATAELVVQLAEGHHKAAHLAAFDIDRFGGKGTTL
ncbi:FAD-dependent oxidoreductase [Altererythrobacter indicus]|uniref:FAD-dependent oxidoreductase n=1 Tax=Altericroceibacterium indicum TaxID=374177 RepID=A0A845AIY3_9SPHN|nr:FAD-dependent oxidoreductase [Altericroceibacterium indicum]MXP27058.1 FAD-dependent oxidoreductase [Altericroceibacterium indicum]